MRDITPMLKKLVEGLEALYPGNAWDEAGIHFDSASIPSTLCDLLYRRHGSLVTMHVDSWGRSHYLGYTIAGTLQYLSDCLKAQCGSRLIKSERWKYSRRFLKMLHELDALADRAAVMSAGVRRDTTSSADAEEAHDAQRQAAAEAVPLPSVHTERVEHDS